MARHWLGIADRVAVHAHDRPSTIAAHVVGGDRISMRGLDRRSNRLARALLHEGLEPGSPVGLLCCDRHAPDFLVGYLAVHKAGLVALVVPVDGERIAARVPAPAVVLACAEGVSAWRGAGGRGLIVGDDTGVVWWKALEVLHPATAVRADVRPDDLADMVLCDDGVVEFTQAEVLARAWLPVPPDNAGLLHAVPLSHPAGLHQVALGALAAGIPQVIQAPFDPGQFARLLPQVPTTCLLARDAASQLGADGTWTATPAGLRWRHPVSVDVDAEGGFGVGLGLLATGLSA